MTSRAAPPIVPAFGDGNQHYTMFFDSGAAQKKDPAPIGREEGEFGKKSQGTNTTNKPSYHKTSKDAVHGSSNQPKHESRKYNVDGDARSSPYKGRLGNRPNASPLRALGDVAQPHGKHGSASSLPHQNQHAKALQFGAWEKNPDVPITEVFDARVQNRGQPFHSPAHWQASNAQEKRSKDSKSPLKWRRMKSKVNLKKWLRRLFGSH
ncbi:hypothetical protein GOP47_0010907 [Adiantum capillus-veneris]|uniref:Uncharacterized protein n=1 Tax=Adiantum capillus-veneris TaxID=13818 RepID=A0A9D4UVX9_ADICA|nr:hypothetical protein GOP47_0010907 [Adiantum capillus-veneris]